MFAQARYFGVGAVPGFGKRRSTTETLHASIVAPPNAGTAVGLLHQYWATGRPCRFAPSPEVVHIRHRRMEP
jgi:hypothetical protein